MVSSRSGRKPWRAACLQSDSCLQIVISQQTGAFKLSHPRCVGTKRFVHLRFGWVGFVHSASDDAALADLFLDNPRINAHFHGESSAERTRLVAEHSESNPVCSSGSAYAGSGAPLLTVPSQSPFSRTGSSVAVMQGRPMDGIAAGLKDFEDSASAYAAAGRCESISTKQRDTCYLDSVAQSLVAVALRWTMHESRCLTKVAGT